MEKWLGSILVIFLITLVILFSFCQPNQLISTGSEINNVITNQTPNSVQTTLYKSHSNEIYKSLYFSTVFPFVHWRYDIRLADAVQASTNYDNINQILQTSKCDDQVIFHLAGFGGEVESAQQLINNIRNCKATVIMSVEAPVFSAHAYLAVSGNYLIMYPYSYLMFHVSSVLNEDCSKETGFDRGVSNREHCEIGKEIEINLEMKLFEEFPVITEPERERLWMGHDVYISPEQYYKRYPTGRIR